MSAEALLTPAWLSFLVGVVLFFARKWVADVAASIAGLEERLRALETALAACRLELVRDHPNRTELDRLEERVEIHATRITILEERCLDD
jgi:hypothetical protein